MKSIIERVATFENNSDIGLYIETKVLTLFLQVSILLLQLLTFRTVFDYISD